jgi:hypothetical protein
MIRFFLFTAQFLTGFSQKVNLVGDARDTNNCLISAGYSWCESSQQCIRQWETPCEDNFVDCNDCLTQQHSGVNIACPSNCDMIAIDPLPPVYYPTDPPPPIAPPPMPEPVCPEVMCMMYCPYDHKVDENGCQQCQCNDPPHTQECPITQPSCSGYNYVCPKITEITHCGLDGIDGYTTYQLSLVVKENSNIGNIYAIYGDDDNVIHFPPSYHSRIFQGRNLGGISDYMKNMFPDTKYDSWLTIGVSDGDPEGTISSIGIDFTLWNINHGLDIDDGAVFVMDPSHVDVSTQGTEIVIAQLTVSSNTSPTVIVNAQGKTINYDNQDVTTRSWTETNIQFQLVPPVYIELSTVPSNCISWYDGCNTCQVENGNIRGCTRMMCFRQDTPRCIQYQSVGH